MVAKRNDVLDLPEYGPGVPVVVVPQRDVLPPLAEIQEGLDVFEEPGLVPAPNLIEFARLTAVHQVASHNHSLQGKDNQSSVLSIDIPTLSGE